MKYKTLLIVTAVLLSLLTVSTLTAEAQQTATQVLTSPQTPITSQYAEDLYKEYATATGGKITFSVQTVESSNMTGLAGKPFTAVVSAPSYRIITDQVGTNLNNPRYFVPQDPSYGMHDMNSAADKFADYGLPLEEGVYRRILVTATIGEDVRTHEAMEFCWSSLNHCAVLDPVVTFLQSKVDTRLSLAAQGWGPRITYTDAATDDATTDDATTNSRGRCGLASHHNWTGETLTWPRWTQTYKDIYGITLVKKYLAQQVDGISCDRRCRPQPFSTSNASSAWGTLGWTTACRNRGDAGKSGSTARSIAETKCTDRWLEQATVSVTTNGGGASISFHWTLGGSVDSNGGVYTDSCSYF